MRLNFHTVLDYCIPLLTDTINLNDYRNFDLPGSWLIDNPAPGVFIENDRLVLLSNADPGMYSLSYEFDDAMLNEAHNLGIEYGHGCQRMGMPLTDALQASMFFRDTMVETALTLPENVNIRPEANVRLLRRINTLLNTVHLAVAEVYDASNNDIVPGA